MKKTIGLFMAVILLFSLVCPVAAADTASGSAVILFTNDVHCNVDTNIGYAGLAAYKAEMEAEYGEANVTLVDAGDALQGAALGTLSQGEYPADIMNEVGYDIMVPGNHEFDYGMSRMLELMGRLKADAVSCNFKSLETNSAVFKPYKIIDYGTFQIAYIGITTPKTFTSSTPKYFQDASGKYIYSFCEDSTGEALYKTVQSSVDAAAAEGADTVIAIGHCGIGDDLKPWQSTDIIANTTGIDAFIDAHSHSVIDGEYYANAKGENVLLASTGTALKAIGKLVVAADGSLSSSLISEYTVKNEKVDAYVKSIQAKNDELLKKVVASSSVPLIVSDPVSGKRLIRSSETNLGDLVTDAYRSLLGADIAVVNGGGIRADIKAGDITYNDIISVHPFGNMACVVEASGQEILDLLEMMARNTPAENGGFMQVSGLTYEIYSYLPSAVKLDDKGTFVSVDGEYRVKNVLVAGKPLELTKTYTLASHNYLIKNGGDGYSKLADNKLLQDEVMIDNQVLITYITGKLGGVVGTEYAGIYGQGRIKVVKTPFTDVANDSWYSDSVSYAFRNGFMDAVKDSSFAPKSDVTKADFISALYELAGSPDAEGDITGIFSDCPDNIAKAVLWAYNKKIVSGSADKKLSPDASLTRRDAAVMIYHFYTSTYGETPESVFELKYTDKDSLTGSYLEAVTFCTANGILNGVAPELFAPDTGTSRAMCAIILDRLAASQVKK